MNTRQDRRKAELIRLAALGTGIGEGLARERFEDGWSYVTELNSFPYWRTPSGERVDGLIERQLTLRMADPDPFGVVASARSLSVAAPNIVRRALGLPPICP